MARDSIMVSGRETPLLPGMAVSAEIATDQRRFIEFFLAPVIRVERDTAGKSLRKVKNWFL